MSGDRQPTCWIVVGPNGAGKTTFALEYLPRIAGWWVFVNADLIAAGLAPLAPERRRVAAGRVFLREIARNIAARRDFGFETTLSGRAHLGLVRRLKADDWRVELIYLALPNVEVAKLRVAERARHGGHDIPLPDIERRFIRSLDNLFGDYVSFMDRAVCFFNVGRTPLHVSRKKASTGWWPSPRSLGCWKKGDAMASPGKFEEEALAALQPGPIFPGR